MPRSRSVSLTALAALGFALAAGPAGGQPGADKFDQIRLSSGVETALVDTLRGNKKFDKKDTRRDLDELMRYAVDKLSHPAMFAQAQDMTAASVPLPMETLITQFNRYVPVPDPSKAPPLDADAYTAAFGESFVAAFKPVVEGSPERIVRMNAARLTAYAARSGAPAIGPFLTELLTNANTTAEVKLYALKAAEGLLAAHDTIRLAAPDHSLKAADLTALLKAIEGIIFDPAKTLVVAAGGADPKAEAVAVVGFIRRQAVKAYAQVRVGSVKAGDGSVALYPGYTLARIAVSDPAIQPPVSPTEVAEAVIGLCGLRQTDNLMVDAQADAVATGVIAFAQARNNPNPNDPVVRSTPWKVLAARLAQAVADWKVATGPPQEKGITPAARNPLRNEVNEIATVAVADVLGPIEGTGGRRLNVEKLVQARQALRAKPNASKTLFRDVPATALEK